MNEGAIVCISETACEGCSASIFAHELSEKIGRKLDFWQKGVFFEKLLEIDNLVQQHEPAMLVFDLAKNSQIQPYLNACRHLRIPYCFVKPEQKIDFSHVAVPVTFLTEEKEKAPFVALFGRFWGSQIAIFEPKDYGTKAKKNVEAITALFDSLQLKYTIAKGKKDSFGIEKEVVLAAPTLNFGVVVVSASREYGLDDLIFGSKEKKILQKSEIPVMLINPRADLYTLCD